MVGRFQNQRRRDAVGHPQDTFLDAGPRPRVLASLGGGALGQGDVDAAGREVAIPPRRRLGVGEVGERSQASP